MSFFKKKTDEMPLQPVAPFEVEPKAAPSPAPTEAPRASSPPASGTSGEAGFDRFGKLRSALGPGTVIQGKLSFDTPVRIDGRLSGEIFSSQAIIVGAGGSIEGDIEVASLIVLGTVRGKIKAHERVEVLAGGRLEADFSAPVFTIEDGGLFNGRAMMTPAGAGAKATAMRSAPGPTPSVPPSGGLNGAAEGRHVVQ